MITVRSTRALERLTLDQSFQRLSMQELEERLEITKAVVYRRTGEAPSPLSCEVRSSFELL